MRLTIGKHAGFCFGVKRAVDAAFALAQEGKPCYTLGPLIHNPQVVRRLEGMGIRVWPNGHGHTGVSHSIHSDYSAVPGYFDQMVAAYGENRAKAILDDWETWRPKFVKVMPIEYRKALEAMQAARVAAE